MASELYPEILDTPEYDGVGDMVAKASASPYIIIAGDGRSAHGVWFVPGLCCELGKDGKVKANYFQEKNALDLVKESDGWKILRVTYDQLDDYETCKGAMRQLSRLLHGESPAQDDWEEGGRRHYKPLYYH